MAINVLQAAKHLCEKSQWKYTNLELQKLLYISHMFYLGTYNKPLIDGTFRALKYGPVHYKLYDKLKYYGTEPIEQHIFNDIEDLDFNKYGKEIKILDLVGSHFPPGSGAKLISITHFPGGAWERNYKYDRNIFPTF